jgi:hypothetical protein
MYIRNNSVDYQFIIIVRNIVHALLRNMSTKLEYLKEFQKVRILSTNYHKG